MQKTMAWLSLIAAIAAVVLAVWTIAQVISVMQGFK